MIVKLTENRFLQLVQKIELINWDWFGIHYAAQRKLPYKNVQYLAMNLSFLFEFQLVPFAFSFILRDPFMVSPPIRCGEEGLFSKKKIPWGDKFGGEMYGGIVPQGETNARSCQKGVGVLQNAFSSNLKTLNLQIFPNHGGIFTWR